MPTQKWILKNYSTIWYIYLFYSEFYEEFKAIWTFKTSYILTLPKTIDKYSHPITILSPSSYREILSTETVYKKVNIQDSIN